MSDEELAANLVTGFERLLQATVRYCEATSGAAPSAATPAGGAAIRAWWREVDSVTAELADAMRAWQRANRVTEPVDAEQGMTRSASVAPPAEPAPLPLVPTARLRFARWLYEQGRISG